MDQNGIDKTALISPMNEPMFHDDRLFHRNMHRIFKFLILNSPSIGLKIYQSLVKDGYFNVYGNQYKIFAKPNNAVVEDTIIRFPDRFLGWVAVNPLLPDTMEELETYLSNPGFIGVKAHPFMHEYSIKALDQVADVCQVKGKPMIIHLSAEQDSYRYLPEKFPKLKLIYAHAGLPFWKSLWTYVKDHPNVYIDTSSDYLNSSIVKDVVQSLGFRKCLYGCDGPYGMTTYNEYDYSSKKTWIDTLPIPENEKEYILGKNFLELICN